jgi:hypothetical protein
VVSAQGVGRACSVSCFFSTSFVYGYSTLTHEAIVDPVWDTDLRLNIPDYSKDRKPSRYLSPGRPPASGQSCSESVIGWNNFSRSRQ